VSLEPVAMEIFQDNLIDSSDCLGVDLVYFICCQYNQSSGFIHFLTALSTYSAMVNELIGLLLWRKNFIVVKVLI
jgi:hypothetical protein